ncbi:MAG: hypothetical protein ABEJ98_00440 [Candidatus Nanohaloarchaea archaeon]
MSAEELAREMYDSEAELTDTPTDLLRLDREDVTGVRVGSVVDRGVMNAMNQGATTSQALEALGEGMEDYRQSLETQLENELSSFEGYELRVRPQVIDTAGATRMVGVVPGYERWISEADDAVELFQGLKQISAREEALLDSQPEDRPDELYDMHRLTGELAGFPDCGVENYAAGTRQNFVESLGIEEEQQSEFRDRYGFLPTPETQMVIEDIEAGNIETVLEYATGERTVDEELPENFHSRFSTAFFPCSIDCEEAVEMGRELESGLEDSDMQTRYRAAKTANVMEYLLGQYEVWKENGAEQEYLQAFETHAEDGEISAFEALENEHAPLEQHLYKQAR